MLTINCDGGARGNPGPAASACVIAKEGRVIVKKSIYLGTATNNIAEYQGVLLAMKELSVLKPKEEILFILDSQLVVNQLLGKFKIKNENLKKLFIEIKKIENSLGVSIKYTSVPREKNKLADFLVNKELDENL